jgi:hypothetical protein
MAAYARAAAAAAVEEEDDEGLGPKLPSQMTADEREAMVCTKRGSTASARAATGCGVSKKKSGV